MLGTDAQIHFVFSFGSKDTPIRRVLAGKILLTRVCIEVMAKRFGSDIWSWISKTCQRFALSQ
jgi:hypothetical protein